MVQQWQSMFYGRRHSQVDLSASADCAMIARACGAVGKSIGSEHELVLSLRQALGCDRPTVLDVHIDPEEPLFPMIRPGSAAVDVVEGPDE
jgi:acetolactate synthase-1/2/3 large subunit